ncbi:MAG TPA: hypothetical protein VD993_11520 [Chitinophagaceae bacterium]|nr:hypothetical protein [Chitinophagaceae bacterium]
MRIPCTPTSLLFTVFIVCSSLVSFSQEKRSVKDLIGKWEGLDESKQKGSLHFLDSNKVVISIGGQDTPPVTYITDFSKDPIWFDLETSGPDGQRMLAKGLLQFIDQNTIKWTTSFSDKRPSKEGSGKDDTSIVLERQRSN